MFVPFWHRYHYLTTNLIPYYCCILISLKGNKDGNLTLFKRDIETRIFIEILSNTKRNNKSLKCRQVFLLNAYNFFFNIAYINDIVAWRDKKIKIKLCQLKSANQLKNLL